MISAMKKIVRNIVGDRTVASIKKALWSLKVPFFFYAHRRVRYRRKIIYTLTPPPCLSNVGDHAQVIAIRAWFKKRFPELPVIELDKDQSRYLLPALRLLVQPDDILFLHSGGNMGDRGIWTETVRRLHISTFPNNKIVSLPQTIFFSDTPIGKKERENTRHIYGLHSNLTIIGRDLRSDELAKELFPKAQVLCMPDFVLSLNTGQLHREKNTSNVLLCLRLDGESVLTDKQRQKIADLIPYPCSYYDTTLSEPIKVNEREIVLESTLGLFYNSDAVITDRYHGLIFAVLCRKPCIVLRTVDHKLTSAIHWFKDVSFVEYAQELDEIPSLLEHLLAVKSREVPDWNSIYFDKIPKLIGLS